MPATYTIGFTPAGYALVRWVAGVPERLGIFATEAAAVAALVAARAT
jgi:hypothetical protein